VFRAEPLMGFEFGGQMGLNCFTIEITCNLTLKIIRQQSQKEFQFMGFLFKVILAI
jgi:hypothetical protein